MKIGFKIQLPQKTQYLVSIVPIDEDIWLKSVSLDWSHRDRCDRVVVALADIEQAAIITSDRKITSFYSQVIW